LSELDVLRVLESLKLNEVSAERKREKERERERERKNERKKEREQRG